LVKKKGAPLTHVVHGVVGAAKRLSTHRLGEYRGVVFVHLTPAQIVMRADVVRMLNAVVLMYEDLHHYDHRYSIDEYTI